MGVFRLIIKAALGCSLVPLALSAIVATLASKPRLAAKAFGSPDNPTKHPADFKLASTDIEYAPGCPAWWVPAAEAIAAVVIVHGFETSTNPRATDPAPRLELAALLTQHHFSSLVISLGYASGAHPHSGGHLEANDIAAAVRWAQMESEMPVAVLGFSAGGHATVTASTRCAPFAIITDSAFVDFADVAATQGAALVNAPKQLLSAISAVMRILNGCAPVNLSKVRIDSDVPMLHLHGDADTAIDHDNLGRLSAITGGRAITFAGANHLEAMQSDPERYESTILAFLGSAIAPA